MAGLPWLHGEFSGQFLGETQVTEGCEFTQTMILLSNLGVSVREFALKTEGVRQDKSCIFRAFSFVMETSSHTFGAPSDTFGATVFLSSFAWISLEWGTIPRQNPLDPFGNFLPGPATSRKFRFLRGNSICKTMEQEQLEFGKRKNYSYRINWINRLQSLTK